VDFNHTDRGYLSYAVIKILTYFNIKFYFIIVGGLILREKRKFGERSKVLFSDEPHRKYFLIYEGKATESIYFEAVDENQNELGISALVELVPISRSYSERGWSNPKKLLDGLMNALKESSRETIRYRTLIDSITDYFDEQNFFAKDERQQEDFFDKLKNFCTDILKVNLETQVKKSDLEKICSRAIKHLKKFYSFENFVVNVKQIISPIGLDYEEGFDKICFVIDRDRKSFTEEQYAIVLQECRKRKFGFYLSNPCFDFWLFLHFHQATSMSDEEKQNFNANEKIGRYTYAEKKLREVFPSYKKTKYDTSVLMKGIDTAIANKKLFCEDEKKLRDLVGSRVGVLISEMRSNERPKIR